MTGIIIVSHGNIASDLMEVSERILGKQENISAVSIQVGESDKVLYEKLENLVNLMKADDIMILSDILGGSITNTCLYFAKMRGHISVITGFNLPMIIKVLTYRDKVNLEELACLACESGRNGIVDACKTYDEKG
ncbi:MAG: PTS sugar transporter subunit IIA [Candidatus Poribacteria bacterium]